MRPPIVEAAARAAARLAAAVGGRAVERRGSMRG
jgi:hypothetical protein